MAVPAVATYTAAAYIAANTGLLSAIDGAATAGEILIRDSADVLLATIVLNDPSGTVDGTTGVLTITAPPQVQATASGTAAYGEITDGDGVVQLSIPAQEGVVPVSGHVVLNTLTIKKNQVIGLVSMTVG
jgi:hypothetical protein